GGPYHPSGRPDGHPGQRARRNRGRGNVGPRTAYPLLSQQTEPLTSVTDSSDNVMVGACQAGLSLSHELVAAGREHVVLERGRVGETWRGRWDSFCLVIPNWTVQLPGGHYRGDDPDGFMPKREIVDHLVTYAERFR